MSVGPIAGSPLPDPGFYTSPSSLPTGLSGGSASSTASSAAAATASSAATSSAAGTPAQISPYLTEYNTLQQQDAAELIQVSLASPDAAQANVADVLAQAAALQQQQLAAQQQAQSTAANATITAPPAVPSLESLIQQSDANANSDLSNGTLGASIDASA